jgi:hypothetical protein
MIDPLEFGDAPSLIPCVTDRFRLSGSPAHAARPGFPTLGKVGAPYSSRWKFGGLPAVFPTGATGISLHSHPRAGIFGYEQVPINAIDTQGMRGCQGLRKLNEPSPAGSRR